MKLKRSYTICGQRWKVIHSKAGDKILKAAKMDGCCDLGNRVIMVRTGHTPDRTFEIFIHEVLHAIVDQSGMELLPGYAKSSHATIDMLGNHLATFFNNNGLLERL